MEEGGGASRTGKGETVRRNASDGVEVFWVVKKEGEIGGESKEVTERYGLGKPNG